MIKIDCACVVCDAYHKISFPVREVVGAEAVDLICPQTGVAIGSCGDETSAMRAAARDTLDAMVLDPECDGYFVSPGVMHALLQAIQAAAELERLSCGCGDDAVEVDIYPEKVELICTSCDSTVVLYAEDEEDLRIATGFQSLTLPALDYHSTRARPNSHHDERLNPFEDGYNS